MMVIMATGKLIQDPQHRTAANGKSYCTALLSVPTDDGHMLVSCIAFNRTVVEKLLVHVKDETVTVLGVGRLSSWEKDGKEQHGLSVTVDKLLTPYEVRGKQRATRDRREEVASHDW